ncbi:PcfJ domain-containing protein [Pararhizobium arenae]|uniref:PcfJ domain-containing protein n=1 Tax=Pararhizobium arenae TaxID=1856850 RepID=UPI00094ABD02|nr:PcfJ domain-containing protein [Pararhizobium arenae]
MSKAKADATHPEWAAAALAYTSALDMPDRELLPIRTLLALGPVRVFLQWWIRQDAIDPEILFDPFSDSEDPMWWQIDGVPSQGGRTEDVVQRKWQRRAALYLDFFGVHVWHVIDWLIVARRRDERWLYNLDESGRPRKLVKCQTIFELVREADKGLRHRKSAAAAPLGSEDEGFVCDLGVGHTLVHLLTPKALQREGSRMHHCIGFGSYDSRLADNDYCLLSVRDPDGRPLATLELDGDVVRQFRGPCNTDPAAHVVHLLAGVADERSWKGLLEAADGRYAPYGHAALRVLENLPPSRRRG